MLFLLLMLLPSISLVLLLVLGADSWWLCARDGVKILRKLEGLITYSTDHSFVSWSPVQKIYFDIVLHGLATRL